MKRAILLVSALIFLFLLSGFFVINPSEEKAAPKEKNFYENKQSALHQQRIGVLVQQRTGRPGETNRNSVFRIKMHQMPCPNV